MEVLWTSIFMKVDKRDKVELLRKLAYVEDFRGLAFLTNVGEARSPVMSMSSLGILEQDRS